MTTRDDSKEAFVERWSRMKQEAKEAPPPQKAPEKAEVDAKAPPPELPPIDKLNIDSDFRGFFHPKVGEDLRRAALKKLFSDPRFNVMDGLDVYIDDYSKTEPIPPEMLAGLRQAQNILRWAKEDTEERERKEKELQAAAQAKLEPPAAQAAPGETVEKTPDTVPAAPPSRSTDA
jgi:Protein of unknown function (DUF3306)